MKTIEIILLTSLFLSFAIYRRRFRSATRDRLLALLVVVLATTAILFPELTTRLANMVGVGRGTDLAFYLCQVATIFFFVLLYSRIANLERMQTELVRRLALRDVEDRPTADRAK